MNGQEWTEAITKENCGDKIKLVRNVSGITRAELAKVIGCSESVITRLESKRTKPTDDFINRLKALCVIGYHKFSKFSDSEKEEYVSEVIGTTGAGILGVGGAIAAVSASGTIAGLSAAGVTSGLAAIGMGSMVAGIGVVAAIPCIAGLAGYGLIKGIKAIAAANDLSIQEVDNRWEIVTQLPSASIKDRDIPSS